MTKESKSHMLLLSYKEKTIKKEQITLSIMGPETITGGGRWWMQGSVDPLMNSGKIFSQTNRILPTLKMETGQSNQTLVKGSLWTFPPTDLISTFGINWASSGDGYPHHNSLFAFPGTSFGIKRILGRFQVYLTSISLLLLISISCHNN